MNPNPNPIPPRAGPRPGDIHRPDAIPAAAKAAAQARARVEIDADAERVWRLLADVDAWPRWNVAVADVRRTEPLAVGSSFEWKSQGFTVTSTVTELQAPQQLAWTGRALGTTALHLWQIEPARHGVVVHTFECFDGWLPQRLPKTMQKKLDKTLPAWLQALKVEAERRNGT